MESANVMGSFRLSLGFQKKDKEAKRYTARQNSLGSPEREVHVTMKV